MTKRAGSAVLLIGAGRMGGALIKGWLKDKRFALLRNEIDTCVRRGGSLIIMDLDRRMTVAYTMNKMGAGVVGSDRTEAYLRAIYDSWTARGLAGPQCVHGLPEP